MRIHIQAPRSTIAAILGTLLLIAASATLSRAQDQEHVKRSAKKNDKGWKLSVISAILPDNMAPKAFGRIEKGTLALQVRDTPVLELPLKSITRITRDTTTDYPAANFMMSVATRPSVEEHRFSSKAYRDEMKARAALGAMSFIGLLFPRHREMVSVSWTDDTGEHDAQLYLGQPEGRAMLKKLQEETGLEPRDLEKERKAMKEAIRELQRWRRKKLGKGQ